MSIVLKDSEARAKLCPYGVTADGKCAAGDCMAWMAADEIKTIAAFVDTTNAVGEDIAVKLLSRIVLEELTLGHKAQIERAFERAKAEGWQAAERRGTLFGVPLEVKKPGGRGFCRRLGREAAT